MVYFAKATQIIRVGVNPLKCNILIKSRKQTEIVCCEIWVITQNNN